MCTWMNKYTLINVCVCIYVGRLLYTWVVLYVSTSINLPLWFYLWKWHSLLFVENLVYMIHISNSVFLPRNMKINWKFDLPLVYIELKTECIYFLRFSYITWFHKEKKWKEIKKALKEKENIFNLRRFACLEQWRN